MNNEVSSSDSENCSDWDIENFHASLLRTRVSTGKSASQKSPRKSFQKLENSTSTEDSDSSSDSEATTDSDWQSRSDSGGQTMDQFIEDFYSGTGLKSQTSEECSSSTSDTYNSSDDETSSSGEFVDSSSCIGSILNDTDHDQSDDPESMNCDAHSYTPLNETTTETDVLATSHEPESEDWNKFFESRGKTDYFSEHNFTNPTCATSGNSDANFETATNAGNIDDPANFFPEEQCCVTLDVLLRLVGILNEMGKNDRSYGTEVRTELLWLKGQFDEIVRDYKSYGIEECADIEQEMTMPIEDDENQLKEYALSEILKVNLLKIEDQLFQNKSDELDSRVSTSKETSRIPVLTQSNSNVDDDQTSDSDSSDSADDIDDVEKFKEYYDRNWKHVAHVKIPRRTQPRSWKDDISSQLRKNWAQSLAYTAETQVEYKLGKEINPDGLRKFGEYLEWDIFNFQAKSAVEYSDMLCDLHNDIGHGRMTDSDREHLMSVAYRNPRNRS